MIQSGEDHIVADKRPIAYRNPALILKMAAGINKDIFPERDIFPAVGVEWGMETEPLVHGLSDEL